MRISKRRAVHAIYWVMFFVTLHYALSLYINSSYLAQFIAESNVGIVYTIGALLSIILLLYSERLVRRRGLYIVTKRTVLIVIGATLLMGAAEWLESPILALSSFFLLYLFTLLERYLLDMYLEEYSKDGETGSLRGIFLTVMNGAILFSPLMAGFLVSPSGFWRVFLVASFALSIGLFIIIIIFKRMPERKRVASKSLFSSFWKVMKKSDIRNILGVHFYLQVFYVVMVIYTPIYLNSEIGFSWPMVGLISAIILSPFVIIQLPLGAIADRWLGEKELLVAGFLLMAIGTFLLPFIGHASFALFTLALLVGRVGAATVEVMTETYFFKQVNDGEAGIISLFRNTQPLAYVIVPALSTILILYFGVRELFFALATLMLFGIYHSLRLKDTR